MQGLKELNELVSSYQGLRENGARGPSIVSAAIANARTCNLDKDIKDLPSDDTDCKLMTIEVCISCCSLPLAVFTAVPLHFVSFYLKVSRMNRYEFRFVLRVSVRC